MIRSAAALSAFILAAGLAQAEELTCQGPFAKDSDHERLVAAFGQENVTLETIHGPEGLEAKASVVFPKDPSRRLMVTWWDEDQLKRPARIEITGTAWAGPKGLRSDTLLADVEAMNGKPFSLYGFGWDYGGAIASWNGGALNQLPGGYRLGIIFEADENASGTILNKASGDSKFSSNSLTMRAAKPKVRSLSIGYPAK